MNTSVKKPFVLVDAALLKPAIVAAFTKLSPRVQWRNPVMFVVYIGSILTTLLGLAMWLGRFGVIVPVLAIAGSLAAKKRLPVTAGTMPTHGPLFVLLLIGTVLLVGLLNYVPALALGPVVEHLVMWSGK